MNSSVNLHTSNLQLKLGLVMVVLWLRCRKIWYKGLRLLVAFCHPSAALFEIDILLLESIVKILSK